MKIITSFISLFFFICFGIKAQDSLTMRKYKNALKYVQETITLDEYNWNFKFCQQTTKYTDTLDSINLDPLERAIWSRNISVSPRMLQKDNFHSVSHDYIMKNYNMTAKEVMANYKLVEALVDSIKNAWTYTEDQKPRGKEEIIKLASKKNTGFILFFSCLNKDSNFFSARLTWYCTGYRDSYSQLPSKLFLFEFDQRGNIEQVYQGKTSP